MSVRPPSVALVSAGPVGGSDGWDRVVPIGASFGPESVAEIGCEHLLLCPAGVEVLPEAAETIREMLIHDPGVDLAYFDSFGPASPTAPPAPGDRSGADGPRLEGHHRPGFSPDRLRAQMYLGDVLLLRRRVVEDHLAEGRDLDLPPTLDQANALAARCRVIAHVPRLLYRTCGPPPGVGPSASASTPSSGGHDRRLAAEGFPAKAVERDETDRVIDLRPRLSGRPRVSIVMPTMGTERELDGRPITLCLRAIDRLVTRTAYRPWELVMVLTPGTPDDLPDRILHVLERYGPELRPVVRFVRDERSFNFSNACNRGAVTAAGDVLVFLNDDTAVRTEDWLDRLVMYATRPDVGAVGARLLYGDGTIQHAGIWSRGGHPAHRYEGFPAEHRGHLDSLTVPQNCLAVTGACLAVEASKFQRAGGFCPDFPSSYNDVDLCLKLDALGHRTVVDPGAELFHYEASSRDPKIEDWELELLHRRWRQRIVDDPYDNPQHLAPGVDEYPPPDPLVTLRRQRVVATTGPTASHLPRLWTRAESLTDRPPAVAGSPTEVDDAR